MRTGRGFSREEAVDTVLQVLDEAVGDQPLQRPRPLHRFVPDRVQRRLFDRSHRLTQYGEELAAHLAVGARVCLAAARRTFVGGFPGQPPGAPFGDRAARAVLVLRGAHQRAQLHGGRRPAGRGQLLLREQCTGQLALGRCRRGRRVLDAGRGAGEDPPDIGVEDGMPLPVREGGHRGRRVLTDSGQREQLPMVAGYIAAVSLRYRLRGPVQPQRAPRIAEPAPGADGLAGRLGREIGGARPAGQPPLVHGEHPADRGLLEHELADHHTPGTGLGAAPGEVAGVLVEPGDDGGVEGGRVGRGDGGVCGGVSHGTPILARHGYRTVLTLGGPPPVGRGPVRRTGPRSPHSSYAW